MAAFCACASGIIRQQAASSLPLSSCPPLHPFSLSLPSTRPLTASSTLLHHAHTQATLGDDSFLNDLDGLGDDSEDEEEEEEEMEPGIGGGKGGGGGKSNNGGVRVKAEDLDSLDDSDEEEEEEGGGDGGKRRRKKKEGGEEDGMDVEGGGEFEKALPKLRGKTLDAVATLSKTRRYREHLEKVQEGMNMVDPPPMSVPLESDPEYQLIVSSNRLVQGEGGREGGKEGGKDSHLINANHSPLPPSLPPSLPPLRHRRGDPDRAPLRR